MFMQTPVLALDVAGQPHDWISHEKALQHYVKGNIAFEAGQSYTSVMGGMQKSGLRSEIRVNSIIAIADARFMGDPYGVTSERVIKRDRNMCAYCGLVFHAKDLTMEHILPRARGGAWSWMNLVAACYPCNARKGCRTPEEAGMPLIYVPYRPNLFESFILAGRNIKADQMDYLLLGVPDTSRLKV
jgi:hypothetical protein